jgi:Carboxypeptidase regulatory-like domain
VSMIRQAATVQGLVRGVTGQPVARASVVLTNGTVTRTFSTADDPLGRFEFANVVPGAYTLTASLPGATPAVLLVNVTASEVRELDIPLQAQASLTGQVLRLSSASNTYVPFADATVRLFLPGSFPGSSQDALAEVLTDANGNYTFLDLEAHADYVVAVYANDASPDPLDSRLVSTVPSTQVTVPPFQIAQVF